MRGARPASQHAEQDLFRAVGEGTMPCFVSPRCLIAARDFLAKNQGCSAS